MVQISSFDNPAYPRLLLGTCQLVVLEGSGVQMESERRCSTEGKDFSEAINNTLRPPAVVLNFQRNKGLDLAGVCES